MAAQLIRAIIAVAGVLLAMPAVAQTAFPGQNGKIAFVHAVESGVGIDRDIWSMNPDGSGQVNLTNDPTRDQSDPDWSPDGRRLAYADADGIRIMNADGSGSVLAIANNASGRAADPAWSPDGTALAFTRRRCFGEDCEWLLFQAKSDGTAEIQLDQGAAGSPSWSPDGGLIAYGFSFFEADDKDIITIHPDGTGRTNLTNTPAQGESAPDWSPDGAKLAFGSFNIEVMNRDGTGRTATSLHGDPHWSPDGTRIAYTGPWGEIWVARADGSEPTQITQGDPLRTDYFYPTWQPLPGPVRGDYRNAAQFCHAERDFLGEQEFRERYGGKPNAFGKCVSSS